MRTEPEHKRVIAFIDGQNLFYAAKEAFGYRFPNVDPQALARAVCVEEDAGWELVETCFYTGVPSIADNPEWNAFWAAKLGAMNNWGIRTFSRPLRYRKQTIHRADGTSEAVRVGQEKGVDIRIALDVVRLAYEGKYDVALLFSQDQDLSEVAKELRVVSDLQQRWIKAVSAFPVSVRSRNRRGINGTDWIKIDQRLFDRCIDAGEYRPPAFGAGIKRSVTRSKTQGPESSTPQGARGSKLHITGPKPLVTEPKPQEVRSQKTHVAETKVQTPVRPKPRITRPKPQGVRGPKPLGTSQQSLVDRSPKSQEKPSPPLAPSTRSSRRHRRGRRRGARQRVRPLPGTVVPPSTTLPPAPRAGTAVQKRPPQAETRALLLGGAKTITHPKRQGRRRR